MQKPFFPQITLSLPGPRAGRCFRGARCSPLLHAGTPDSASSFKLRRSPLLPPTSVPQPWTRRRSSHPAPAPLNAPSAKRRRRRRRARTPAGRGFGGPGADGQPSGRRTFPSVLNARRPACVAAPSVPGNDRQDLTQAWTPEELAYAARVSDLYGRGVLPNCPAPTQCRISELWDDGVVARERRRYGWITIFQRRRASRSAFYYRGS